MHATTTCEFGEIILVGFPFTNLQSSKKRPAVVISSKAYNRQRDDVILLAITSQLHPSMGFGDCRIEDWKSAGLLKESVFKPLIATIDKSRLMGRLGRLASQDLWKMTNLLQSVLGEGAEETFDE